MSVCNSLKLNSFSLFQFHAKSIPTCSSYLVVWYEILVVRKEFSSNIPCTSITFFVILSHYLLPKGFWRNLWKVSLCCTIQVVLSHVPAIEFVGLKVDQNNLNLVYDVNLFICLIDWSLLTNPVSLSIFCNDILPSVGYHYFPFINIFSLLPIFYFLESSLYLSQLYHYLVFSRSLRTTFWSLGFSFQ